MQTVVLTRMAQDAGIAAGILATRLNGQRFFPPFADRLRQLPPDQGLLVDGTGVAILDASFADEVFGVVASSRACAEWKGKCFVLCGFSDDNVKNIAVALDSRALHSTGVRNCVLPVGDGTGERLSPSAVHLIGKVEGHVRESFAVLLCQRTLTARTLAATVGRDIHAASTRLKVLHDLGLATRAEMRDGHGREYVYGWPF